MKRLFSVIACLLLSCICVVWGAAADSSVQPSTLGLEVEIPSSEEFKIYAYDFQSATYAPANLVDTIDWMGEGSRMVYKIYYSGNQEKTRNLTVKLSPTSFRLIDSPVEANVALGANFDNENYIWVYGDESAAVSIEKTGISIPVGFVDGFHGVDESLFTISWDPQTFSEAPAGTYQADVQVEMKLD